MLSLDDPMWRELRHAYGEGSDIVAWLSTLRESKPLRDDLFDVHPWDSLCHQWTVYPATFAAVPHIVDIVSRHPANDRSRMALLSFVGWSAAISQLPGSEFPESLRRPYEAALLTAATLIAESIVFADTDDADPSANYPHTFRSLLSALAACRGAYPLAFIISQIKEGTKCPHCRQWIQPLKSEMNPLFRADGGYTPRGQD